MYSHRFVGWELFEKGKDVVAPIVLSVFTAVFGALAIHYFKEQNNMLPAVSFEIATAMTAFGTILSGIRGIRNYADYVRTMRLPEVLRMQSTHYGQQAEKELLEEFKQQKEEKAKIQLWNIADKEIVTKEAFKKLIAPLVL